MTGGKLPRSPIQAHSSQVRLRRCFRVRHGLDRQLLRAELGPVLLPGLSEQGPSSGQLDPPLRPAGSVPERVLC